MYIPTLERLLPYPMQRVPREDTEPKVGIFPFERHTVRPARLVLDAAQGAGRDRMAVHLWPYSSCRVFTLWCILHNGVK